VKVTLSWLRELVRTPLDAAGVAERLTMGGLEVESVEEVGRDIAGVVVAEIASKTPHPEAEGLFICGVRTGTEAAVSVVCGATNMKPGDRVAYAPPGTVLPGGHRIEAREVRGVHSAGMLCSEAELGLSDDAGGLLILDRAAPLGERVGAYLGVEDSVLDVSVPPNRGDCLSVLGLARELAALEGSRIVRQRIAVRERGGSAADAVQVRIEDAGGCARYAARLVRNVRVAPSPRWMQWRLSAAGLRPINNVVDVTNYVMLERGQPLHAFDYARLPRPEIVVRRAGMVTTFATLDGAGRELDAADLLITTGAEPVAIAGVMGGAATEVSGATSTVLLESAWFEPGVVRRTARRLGLHSESSYRFERGVDIEGVPAALDRAAALLHDLAAGEVAPGMVDVYPHVRRSAPIEVRLKRVNDVLGTSFGRPEVIAAAKALGAAVAPGARGTVTVSPPLYRLDLTREIDVIEEVARLLGYHRIAPSMPVVALDGGRLPERMQWVRRLQRMLVARGLSEFVTFSFNGARANEIFPGLNARGEPVRLLNPMNREEAELRRSLLPGLLEGLRLNRSHGQGGVAAFSIGKVFWKTATVHEAWRLAGMVAGELPRRGLGPRQVATFADAKGVVESICETLRVAPAVRWTRTENGPFHPGRSATMTCAGERAGTLGVLHPDLEAELQVGDADWLFELDLEKLLTYVPRRLLYRELPRFPAVVRDLAIVSDEDFASEQVIDFVRTWGNALVENVELFDEYAGAPIPAGRKSLAYTIRYRAPDRTLTDEEVNGVHAALTLAITQALAVELRQ
jgi:phenylalanyl-tRNA synthetase beta chain